MKFEVDQFSWENLTPENSNSIDSLIKEFENAPPPIEAPVIPETPTPEATGQPAAPPKTASGASGASQIEETTAITSRMIMKGWNALFAGISVFVSGQSEKYEFYKAAERDVNELADLFTEMQKAYNWNIAPWMPFAIGFVGIYGAKSFEVYQDRMKGAQKPEDVQQRIEKVSENLDAEIELAEKQARLNELKASAAGNTKTGRGTKPGTKRGPYKKRAS